MGCCTLLPLITLQAPADWPDGGALHRSQQLDGVASADRAGT